MDTRLATNTVTIIFANNRIFLARETYDLLKNIREPFLIS